MSFERAFYKEIKIAFCPDYSYWEYIAQLIAQE
jgi:hypothetical protein